MTFRLSCLNKHDNTWSTDEFYERLSKQGNRRSKVNAKLSTYILVTGNNFDPLRVWLHKDVCMKQAKIPLC